MHLQPTIEGLSRAVPVILLDQRKMYAEQDEIYAESRGFLLIRDRKGFLRRAVQYEHVDAPLPTRYRSQAGECGVQPLPAIAREVYALRGEDGQWI